MAEPSQQDLIDFERNRNQLLTISAQKQQIQVQASTLGKAIEELGKTAEKKVYKAVGNILILSDTADTKKELETAKETLDVRVKTLQKQEDATLAKLNSIKNKIEGKPAEEPSEPTNDEETRLASSKKNRK